MPLLYIITGSNGAGKSSVGPDYLPSSLRESVFDGDKIFMQKRSEYWRQGIQSHKECKKLAAAFVGETFDNLVDAALMTNADFAYEGHFTNDATWDIPKRFKEAGYEIHLLFLGLSDIVASEKRVRDRVEEGGHYVYPQTVAANFYGNLEKLDKYFPIFDSITILDSSKKKHVGMAFLRNGVCVSAVGPEELPDWFRENLPVITKVIKSAVSD